MNALAGKIALVAGATRGAGRGIATALGEQGAIVYCTGRSVRGKPATGNRPETIEETADLVTARGGTGIAVQTDHTEPSQVAALVHRIANEQGRLDLLVNDIWGGDDVVQWGKRFWDVDLDAHLALIDRAIKSHLITSHHAVPLMREGGLIVEITDGDGYFYRGNLYYDFIKTSVIRLAFAQACELKAKGINAVAVTPGFLRSEAMLEHFGVTEANWRDAAKKEKSFIASETPLFVGRAVAALASDPEIARKNGRVFASWTLGDEYGFVDADGARPHFRRWMEVNLGAEYAWKPCDELFWSYCTSNYTDLITQALTNS
jgi:NAD(P)-dependent dehydrogenase (short-subunit alcohol dehydrogenase family)